MSYDEIAYDPDNDFDYDEEEDELLEQKRKEIEHFTIEDYMSCKKTKDLLINNWRQKFNDDLEEKINDIFFDNLTYMKQTSANILTRAEKYHNEDLISLIRFHLAKEYDVSVFDEDPNLADPLLEDYNKIKMEKQRELQRKYAKELAKSKEIYDWSKRKK